MYAANNCVESGSKQDFTSPSVEISRGFFFGVMMDERIGLDQVLASIESPVVGLIPDYKEPDPKSLSQLNIYDRFEREAQRDLQARQHRGERCSPMNPMAWNFGGGDWEE